MVLYRNETDTPYASASSDLAPFQELLIGTWSNGGVPRHTTHDQCHANFKTFKAAILGFLRDTVPRNRHRFCDQVADTVRVIDPADFRVLG